LLPLAYFPLVFGIVACFHLPTTTCFAIVVAHVCLLSPLFLAPTCLLSPTFAIFCHRHLPILACLFPPLGTFFIFAYFVICMIALLFVCLSFELMPLA
jgi:hypothetical protein